MTTKLDKRTVVIVGGGLTAALVARQLTAKGTDVLVGFGFSYSSILNTVGVQFEIMPLLLVNSMRPGATPLGGQGNVSNGQGR